MKQVVYFLFASAICFTACKNSRQSATAAATDSTNAGGQQLYGRYWKLISIADKSVPTNSQAHLILESGETKKVFGNTGCNNLSGSFSLSDSSKVHFSAVATTRMACTNKDAAEVEANFLRTLSEATEWRINNDVLSLMSAEKEIAVFIAKPADRANASLNGSWQLQFISGPKIAFEGLFPHEKPTINFSLPKLEASGNGSCNTYTAGIIADSSRLQFGDPLSTMMACEENGEPLYFKTLKMVTNYRISNDTLIMLANNTAVLRFTKIKR